MLYIICALKPEAQAFVDKYKLGKLKKNDDIVVILSGIGVENSFNATKKIVEIMDDSDTILNVGICGGDKKFAIGELLEVCISTKSVEGRGFLTCVDSEVSKSGEYELVDMESDGFIQASLDVENKYMFKVVSDHFEPHKVTKQMTKSLVFNVIDDINKQINLEMLT